MAFTLCCLGRSNGPTAVVNVPAFTRSYRGVRMARGTRERLSRRWRTQRPSPIVASHKSGCDCRQTFFRGSVTVGMPPLDLLTVQVDANQPAVRASIRPSHTAKQRHGTNAFGAPRGRERRASLAGPPGPGKARRGLFEIASAQGPGNRFVRSCGHATAWCKGARGPSRQSVCICRFSRQASSADS